jgi:hypothetical protein
MPARPQTSEAIASRLSRLGQAVDDGQSASQAGLPAERIPRQSGTGQQDGAFEPAR